MNKAQVRKQEAFDALLKTMDELREHCPWDRQQTMESLRYMTLEEVFELTEAILHQDPEDIKKELGDVWLHIVFYSKIADEQGWFDIADVAESLVAKLKYRHPHIYGDAQAKTTEAVKTNWEKLKLREGNKRVLSGLPEGLPSLVKAYRLQEKAAGCGFEWDQTGPVIEKVREEVEEFLSLVHQKPNDQKALEHELGDLFFSLVNLSRYLNINPVNALDRTNQKFVRRFNYIEDAARQQQRSLHDMSLAEMDALWDEAKRLESQPFNQETKTK